MILQAMPNVISLLLCIFVVWLTTFIKGNTLGKKSLRLVILSIVALVLGNLISWKMISVRPIAPDVAQAIIGLALGIWIIWAVNHESPIKSPTVT